MGSLFLSFPNPGYADTSDRASVTLRRVPMSGIPLTMTAPPTRRVGRKLTAASGKDGTIPEGDPHDYRNAEAMIGIAVVLSRPIHREPNELM